MCIRDSLTMRFCDVTFQWVMKLHRTDFQRTIADEFIRVALHFQRHAAIVLVLHPAGQVEGLRGVPRPIAETRCV